MSAAILCVGKLRERYWQDAAAEYEKRLSRYMKLEIIQVDDLAEPVNASPAQRQQVMEREGAALLARLRPGDRVTALCIDAPQVTSEALAQSLRTSLALPGRAVFIIGGSLGLSPQVLSRADSRLSMSQMTFPHALARVMLLEQLYRAAKINARERYHK